MTNTQPACQVASPRGIRRSMSKPFARRRETLRERTCPAADDEETSGPSGNRRIRHTLSRPFWNNKGRKQCVSRTVPPYEDCAPPPPPLSPHALPLSPQRTLAAGPPPPETVAQTPPQSEPPSSPQPDVTQTPQSEPPCSPPPEGAPTHKRTRSVAKSKPFWEIKMDKECLPCSPRLPPPLLPSPPSLPSSSRLPASRLPPPSHLPGRTSVVGQPQRPLQPRQLGRAATL